jgi:phosphoribosylaminoimidazolecarboxamide formyltransferase/IMP cyclohydrolase
MKHANPCGTALGASLADAYQRALACDPVSAFGGVIALNRALDGETASLIAELFAEVVIAPDADADARAVLADKKNLRLLVTGAMPDAGERSPTLRALAGGYLLQDRDGAVVDEDGLHTVTKRKPDEAEMTDLRFAFTLAKHVKSNAIVYVKDRASVGVGAGQMSRVDSARIAAQKAAEAQAAAGESESRTAGSVVASDAFFPFADGLLVTIEAGAKAVIQPGGSVRDDEVIAAADEAGIAMVFTGMRHFRH